MKVLALLLVVSAHAQPARGPHGTAEIVAETRSFVPGRPIEAGILFKLEPGWHVYWKNPGDSGEPPRASWRLPSGFSAGTIQWPVPKVIRVGPLANFGYEGSVLFPVRIQTPPGARKAELKADLEWLICKEECLPAAGQARLTLPAAASAAPDPRRTALFAKAREALPAPRPGLSVSAKAREGGFELSVRPPGEYVFFPADPLTLEHAAPQLAETAGGVTRLLLVGSEAALKRPERLRGTLALPEGGGVDLDLPLSGGGLPLWALWGAFAGGILLNLMPCVFPVLAIKALGFIQAKDKPLLKHGLAYSAGVIACFLALGALLLALRAGGAVVGWGFQLQSPPFTAAMALLFLLIALNMLGVFEVALAFSGAGGGGAFLSGVFAVLVATPCTAPFMGAALGLALTLSAPAAMALFAALGAGMAAPYLFLCWRPGALRLLPKPGAWMETLKQALAFPMLAAAVWLFWVFARQAGADAAARLLWAAWCAGLAAWVWGRWGAKFAAPVLGAALALALGAAGVLAPEPDPLWEPWSREREASLRAEGRPVLVDYTAAWCITCQVNERGALSSRAVRARMKEVGVAALKADWTNRDPEITESLGRLGRSGVPVYAYYAPGAKEARLLPTILTPGILLDALKKI